MIILILFLVLTILIIYSCCRASSIADEKIERMIRDVKNDKKNS